MTPYYEEAGVTIYHGDAREVLRSVASESIHAIVTDPPYGLSFMGRKWDYDVPSADTWRECLRVLKPGGHLLAFSGTRTYHRAVVNIEDAGFEIRDMIGWVYGSGFPKSLDVGKAIDKEAGAEREVVGKHPNPASAIFTTATPDTVFLTAPATEAAKQWDGWGTGLKPAHEPICLARKPLDGTVAANVLAHGTGALNIEACRVGTENIKTIDRGENYKGNIYGKFTGCNSSMHVGRWPANLIHDGSPEVLAVFPQIDGKVGMTKHGSGTNSVYGEFNRSAQSLVIDGVSDSGSAARFFYTAKADGKDRGVQSNDHPTVKPTDLIRYLVMLVTPPGGLILDPFMGSGTTLRVALDLGHPAIGIDSDEHSCEIAAKRLSQGVLDFGAKE